MEAIARLTFSWLGTQTAYLSISQIDPMDFALLTFRIKGVVIGRIEQDVKTVAAGKRSPIAVANAFLTLSSAPPHPVFFVWEAAGYSKMRLRVGEQNPVIFARRDLVQMIPVFPASKTLIHAAIRPEQQTLANWRFRGLVFVFRCGRLWRRHSAWLNCERVTVRVHFLA